MKALLISKRSALVLAQTLGLVAVLGLSGCASKMTKQECESTDFYQMGVDDGSHGRTADRYAQQSQECKQDGVGAPRSKVQLRPPKWVWQNIARIAWRKKKPKPAIPTRSA